MGVTTLLNLGMLRLVEQRNALHGCVGVDCACPPLPLLLRQEKPVFGEQKWLLSKQEGKRVEQGGDS